MSSSGLDCRIRYVPHKGRFWNRSLKHNGQLEREKSCRMERQPRSGGKNIAVGGAKPRKRLSETHGCGQAFFRPPGMEWARALLAPTPCQTAVKPNNASTVGCASRLRRYAPPTAMFLRAYGAVFSAEETFRIPERLVIGEGRCKMATLPTLLRNRAKEKLPFSYLRYSTSFTTARGVSDRILSMAA